MCSNWSGNVLYIFAFVLWAGFGALHTDFKTAYPQKSRNKSFVWLIHNTNFGLKYALEGSEIDPTPKSHLWKFSFSPIPLIPSHSLKMSMHFSSCLSCHLPKEASGGQSHSATVLLSSALPSFLLKLPPRVLSLHSYWMSGSSLQLKQSPHDQTPTSLRVRER